MGPKKAIVPVFKQPVKQGQALQPQQQQQSQSSQQLPARQVISKQHAQQQQQQQQQSSQWSNSGATSGVKSMLSGGRSHVVVQGHHGSQGARQHVHPVPAMMGEGGGAGNKRKAGHQGGRSAAHVVPDQDAWAESDNDDDNEGVVVSSKKPKVAAGNGAQSGGKNAAEGGGPGAFTLGRMTIDKLAPLVANVAIAGMVVGVRDVNSFISKKSGMETFVRHFVLKDDAGTIDCVLWADTNDKFLELLQIGNLVELIGPDVRSRQESDKFKGVRTTSPYELHISPARGGAVLQYSGEEAFREPLVKQGWMPLGDLVQLGDQLIDAEVSLLACVKKINPVQEIVTKQEKRLCKRELVLFDQTDTVLDVTLWGESANCLGLFVPVQTIVLITNVKVTSFRGNIQGTLGFSSLVDVNPDLLEGALLYDYAQTVAVDDEDFGRRKKDIHQDLSKVTEKVTMKELETKVMQLRKGEGFACFGTFNLSRFDIDSDCESHEIVVATCQQCKARFSAERSCSCDPESELPGYLSPNVTLHYDLVVSFIDATGSFTTRVSPDIAHSLLTFPADEFPLLEFEQRTKMKAARLFEPFRVYFKVDWTNSKDHRVPRITVLDCQHLRE